MDSITISMFRNLEQQAIRESYAHEVTHKNAIKLIVANKFYLNTPENAETTQNIEPTKNTENQEPTSYRLNYLA